MARRGQGDINPRTALEAGKSRARASQAEKEKAAFHERSAQDIRRGAAAADQAIQYQTEKIKAKKIRGEETAFREKQFQEKQLQAQTAEQQRQEQLNLQAASQGMQPKGERPETPREQALREEMERGSTQQADPGLERLRQQGEKPLEVPGERVGTVPGQGGGAAEFERKETGPSYAEQTERIRQEANRQKAKNAFAKAQINQDAEAMAAAENELLAKPRKTMGELQTLMNYDPINPKAKKPDWGKLMAKYGDNPNVVAEIEAKGENGIANLSRLMKNEVAKDVIPVVASTGVIPQDLWDETSPVAQQFNDLRMQNNDLIRDLRIGGDVRSVTEKNRRLNRIAALAMMQLQQKQTAGNIISRFIGQGAGVPGGGPGAGPGTGGGGMGPPPLGQRPTSPQEYDAWLEAQNEPGITTAGQQQPSIPPEYQRGEGPPESVFEAAAEKQGAVHPSGERKGRRYVGREVRSRYGGGSSK